jgi:hypothetical protein
MNDDEIKYNRVLHVLRKSKPVLSSPEDIEAKVMRRIIQKQDKKESPPGFLDFLFGWVYIGWVRSGLVTVSILLVAVFLYQQAVIIKRINNLDSQAIFIENQMVTGSSDIPHENSFYRLAGEKLPARRLTISEKQVNRLIRSYNELEEKYKDLVRLIEEDPELKKYVEEKLNVNSRKKFNL